MAERLISDNWQEAFGKLRIAVWGDMCLDHYRYGTVREVAREAPVVALHLEHEAITGGQAANVALNLVALGASVNAFGVIGSDHEGIKLLDLMTSAGIGCSGVLMGGRDTELREKLVAESAHQPSQHILHVYRENTRPHNATIINKLLTTFTEGLSSFDALLIPDYSNGLCTPNALGQLIEMGKENRIPVIANTRRTLTIYTGVSGMTINLKQTAGQEPEKLRQKLELDWLLVTEGGRGMTWYGSEGELHLDPPGTKPVVDITGAGDTVLAWVCAGFTAGLKPDETLQLANLAAQAAVSRAGTTAPTAAEVKIVIQQNHNS